MLIESNSLHTENNIREKIGLARSQSCNEEAVMEFH